MGNSPQKARQREVHANPAHGQYRNFNPGGEPHVPATSSRYHDMHQPAQCHDRDTPKRHQELCAHGSQQPEMLQKMADLSRGKEDFLSTEDLMSNIEELCKRTVEIITTIREEGKINADIRLFLNMYLKETEQELHTYNSLTTDVHANSPTQEKKYAMLKKIEDDLNKSITKRQNKMAEVRKEPNEKALIERQRQEIEEMRTNIKRMNVEHSGLQTKLDHLTRKVKGLQKNNEDLVLRLSKLASDKLVENNPAIADLSDQNRPTKLGEAFKELYDCKWTDAFEALATDGRSDEQAIRILRETLQNVAAFCKKKAEIFIQELDKVVVNVFDTQNLDDAELKRRTMIGGVKGAKLTKEEFKEMELFGSWTSSKQTEKKTATDIMHITMRRKSKITASMEKTRKEIAVTLLSSLQKAYFTHCLWSENYIPEMKPFIKECLRISWLTVVQRPPMCFLWEDGLVNRKATQVYVPYTRFGTVLDYIVWPALLLREEGEIIAKGVAQFKED